MRLNFTQERATVLNNIRIVLVKTSHPGNIGSAARAMKTMGLNQLYLVAPEKYPHPKAQELASNAGDVLEQAIVTETLDQALEGCHLVLGTSTRDRTIPWPILSPREMSEKLLAESPNTQIAILFGCEESGLSNEELHRCHYHIQIPANPAYSSLNLAAAVQVICYELRIASLQNPTLSADWDYEWSDAVQVEKFFEHLERTLIHIDFLDPAVPRKLMPRLRRLFARTRIDVLEMNMLRGILSAIEKR